MKRLKPHVALAALSAMASMSTSRTDTRRSLDTGDPPPLIKSGIYSISSDGNSDGGGLAKKEVTAWSGSSAMIDNSIYCGPFDIAPIGSGASTIGINTGLGSA